MPNFKKIIQILDKEYLKENYTNGAVCKKLIISILVLCFVVLMWFLIRPTVGKVQKMQDSGDLTGLQNILIKVNDSDFYKDVRIAAIKAIVELDTYDGDIWLTKMMLDNKTNKNLEAEIINVRKDVVNERLKKDSNYVNKKILKYINLADIKQNDIELYVGIQKIFTGWGYEEKIDTAIASNILRRLDINSATNNQGNEDYLNYIKRNLSKSKNYINSIEEYFKITEDIKSIQSRIDSIDSIIKKNIDEYKQIEKYFGPQATMFRDNVVRGMMQKIYQTQGLDAALKYNQYVAEDHKRRIDRYYEIPNENKRLEAERKSISLQQQERLKEQARILQELKNQGSRYCENIISQ